MSKQHNILILKFPYSSTFGGGEKHTITLVEKLKDKHNFWLVSSCSELVPEFKKRHWNVEAAWAGTEPVTPLALAKFFFTAPFITLHLIRIVLRYRKHHHIDTLYCLSLTEKVLITPFAKLLGLRVIWIEHLQIERWLLASPLRFGYVLFSRWATIIAVVAAVKKQLVIIGVKEKYIQVIYNSINIHEFTPHPSDPNKINNSFDILFVGRLAIEKGIDDLINAVHYLQSKIPQIKLTIVGQGEWQAELELLVKEKNLQNIVSFVGWQKDIPQWMQQCDVFVLPATRRETFGIVVAEALATIKPVIATYTGGLAEVVSKYGWLVEPHQPKEIASALSEIYNDYDSALHKAEGGRLHVLELFREDTMIQEYDKLFS